MKVEFFVESVYYHTDNPTPSIIIVIRNNLKNLTPDDPIFVDSKSDMKKIMKELFNDALQTHRTSFVIGLEKYRQSGIMIGDRLEIEMTIKDNGRFAE